MTPPGRFCPPAKRGCAAGRSRGARKPGALRRRPAAGYPDGVRLGDATPLRGTTKEGSGHRRSRGHFYRRFVPGG
jgi:hypothetical protein